MSEIEILLLNYFSVLFFTVYISIYVKNPERILSVFTFWFVLVQIVFAFLIYKLIQFYHAFTAIYIADAIMILISLLVAFKNRPKVSANKHPKKQVIDKSILKLSNSMNSLHRLSNSNFEQNTISLLKQYNFQTFKQITVESDDSGSKPDTYYLAWCEGELVEIRTLSKLKTLTPEHIEKVANQFRESTAQASTLILITSAEVDQAVKSTIKDHGIEFKIFDQSAIQSLVFSITGETRSGDQNRVKELSLHVIDRTMAKLSAYRNKLADQKDKPAPQDLLKTISPAIATESKDIDQDTKAPIEAHKTPVEVNNKNSVVQNPADAESDDRHGESIEEDQSEDVQKAIEAEAADECFTVEPDVLDDDFTMTTTQSVDTSVLMDDDFDDFDTVDVEPTSTNTSNDSTVEKTATDTAVETPTESSIESTDLKPTPGYDTSHDHEVITPDIELTTTIDEAQPVEEHLVPDTDMNHEIQIDPTEEVITPDVELTTTIDEAQPVEEHLIPDTDMNHEIQIDPTEEVITPDVELTTTIEVEPVEEVEALVPDEHAFEVTIDEVVTPDVVFTQIIDVELPEGYVVPDTPSESEVAVMGSEEQPVPDNVITPDIDKPLFNHDESDLNTIDFKEKIIIGEIDIDDLGSRANISDDQGFKRPRRRKKNG